MYLNIIQLAESFGVSEGTVEAWVRDEGLPHVQDRDRMLFDRAQVVAWAAERGLVAQAGFLAPERTPGAPAARLERWLRVGGIWRDVPEANVAGVLERVVAALPGVTPAVHQLLGQRVHAPGGVTWAPVGGGLALPHLRSRVALGRDAGVLALVLLRDGESVGVADPPDGMPVTRLLFFVAPSPRVHLELLGQLSTALTRGGLRPPVSAGAPDAAIFAAVAAADAVDAPKEVRS